MRAFNPWTKKQTNKLTFHNLSRVYCNTVKVFSFLIQVKYFDSRCLVKSLETDRCANNPFKFLLSGNGMDLFIGFLTKNVDLVNCKYYTFNTVSAVVQYQKTEHYPW